MLGKEKMPLPEQEVEPTEPIPSGKLEVLYPYGAPITDAKTGANFYVRAFDAEHGWIFAEAEQWELEQNEEARKSLLDLKRQNQKELIKNMKNVFTGEPATEKQKQRFTGWSTDNPYLVAIDAKDLLEGGIELERGVGKNDVDVFERVEFKDPETQEVVRIFDADPQARVFEVRNSMGVSKSLKPKEIFNKYEMTEAGLKIPFPGDNWAVKSTLGDRMVEPKIVTINYTDIPSGIVYFAVPGEKGEKAMMLEKFTEDFLEIVE